MQSLRIKFGERRSDWRCCFCCHVRTGTIFLGMYHFLINLLTLSGLALMVRYPDYFDEDMDILPTPLSEIDDESIPGIQISEVNGNFNLGDRPQIPMTRNYRTLVHISPKDWNISVFFTMCTLGLTLLLLYGAFKKKPSYLMPFFGYQVFNFCVSSMAVVSYLCYPPNINQMIQDKNYMPFKEELMHVSPQTLSLYVVLALLFVMMIKAYFIGVVWSCYKYLTLRQVATQRTLHFIDPDNQNLIHDLPDYETAVKKFPTPPPSYATAVLGEGESSTSAAGASASSTAAVVTPVPQQPWLVVRTPADVSVQAPPSAQQV